MLRDDPGLFRVRDDVQERSQQLFILAAAVQHARRAPLERALQVAIVVTVFGAMLASGAILDWLAAGRKLRWAGLALVALAVAYARSRGVRARTARAVLRSLRRSPCSPSSPSRGRRIHGAASAAAARSRCCSRRRL